MCADRFQNQIQKLEKVNASPCSPLVAYQHRAMLQVPADDRSFELAKDLGQLLQLLEQSPSDGSSDADALDQNCTEASPKDAALAAAATVGLCGERAELTWKLFSEWDHDASGYLSLSAFCELLIGYDSRIQAENLTQLFGSLVTDGDRMSFTVFCGWIWSTFSDLADADFVSGLSIMISNRKDVEASESGDQATVVPCAQLPKILLCYSASAQNHAMELFFALDTSGRVHPIMLPVECCEGSLK